MGITDPTPMSLGFAEARTARLVCRRPVAGEGADYRRLLLDPSVAAWLRPAPLPPFRDDEPEALLRKDIAHWDTHGFGPWSLVDRSAGSYVGRGGLAWTHIGGERLVELPWALVSERWNEGLATEAATAAIEVARRLRLDEVVSLALIENGPSRRVMEKAGLTYAGDVEHVGLPHALYRLALRDAP